jgi:hypothetical protein
VVLETVHEQGESAAPWRERLRSRLERLRRGALQPAPGDWELGENSGWAGETLLHSARMERMRAALPPLWSMMIGTARLLLLTALLLPATALWTSALQNQPLDARSATFLAALAVATLALLVSRWRARNLGTFSLLLCSGVALATPLLALLHDTAWRFAPGGDASTRAILPRSLLGLGALDGTGSVPRLVSSHLGGADAAYLVGAALVCGVAIVSGAQLSRRELFMQPPLEVRHVHPWNAPLPAASSAQLRLVRFWMLIAVLLALRPLGEALGAAWLLVVAGALTVWGWHRKALAAKDILLALLGAGVIGAVLLVLWAVSGGRGVSGVMPALLVWKDALATLPAVALRRAVLHKWEVALSIALFAAALRTLYRQPPHLWSILSHAPAWGWLAVSSLGILPLAVLLLPGVSHAMLAVAIVPALLFVWLEGA